jgi:hypothetical protein
MSDNIVFTESVPINTIETLYENPIETLYETTIETHYETHNEIPEENKNNNNNSKYSFMTDFGFIISRHVNNEKTNRYWNQSVKLIRTYYPFKLIVIIDDNSNQQFVKPGFPYKNLIIIQSEFPGRGELLPYYYFLKYKWFKKAVIIHDSIFIHRRIPFEKINLPVLPLWHHIYDKENIHNLIRIASSLNRSYELIKKLTTNDSNNIIFGKPNKDSFNLVFGSQAFITLNFLEFIQQKYNFTNLVNVIHDRADRCSLERIMGLLFSMEYPQIKQKGSLFGDIIPKNNSFRYSYEEYQNDLRKKKVLYPFVKVWTGR